MRVLFLPIPGIGHAFPQVPLAWALRTAGHDVLFGSAGDSLAVREAGLPVVDLKLNDRPEVFIEIERRYPEIAAAFRGDNGGGLNDMADAVPVIAEISSQILDSILDLADAWRPDLIVHSPMHGAALLAAARRAVPSISVYDGFGYSGALAPALYTHMADTFAAHGASGLPETLVRLDATPPSMVGAVSNDWPMRYIPFNGGTVLPEWLAPGAPEPKQPRIAVTLGSVAPQLNGLAPISPILALAGDIDAEFVLALGDVDTDNLGELSPNVRVAGWVPLADLLPTCTALVHHGGSGTTLTALQTGVAQLVLPGGGDGLINARAVQARGSGIMTTAEEVDADLLRRLVDETKLHAVAAEVSAEIAAMPVPADLVPRLVDLAGHGA